jgi:hypothetical protein
VSSGRPPGLDLPRARLGAEVVQVLRASRCPSTRLPGGQSRTRSAGARTLRAYLRHRATTTPMSTSGGDPPRTGRERRRAAADLSLRHDDRPVPRRPGGVYRPSSRIRTTLSPICGLPAPPAVRSERDGRFRVMAFGRRPAGRRGADWVPPFHADGAAEGDCTRPHRNTPMYLLPLIGAPTHDSRRSGTT